MAATEKIVSGLLQRRFDLGLISLPYNEDGLRILPLFRRQGLRPSPHRVSNMRSIIDGFFPEIGISPRVVLEADDTEAIKRLVESGFGHSILPQFALRGSMKFYQTFRVAGRRLVRRQALAMAQTAYPWALTESIADFIRATLAHS